VIFTIEPTALCPVLVNYGLIKLGSLIGWPMHAAPGGRRDSAWVVGYRPSATTSRSTMSGRRRRRRS
jgi:hypothetical protein